MKLYLVHFLETFHLLTALPVYILVYVIWIAVTNFIVMRSILSNAKSYDVERRALSAVNIAARSELPLDLFGILVMLVGYI